MKFLFLINGGYGSPLVDMKIYDVKDYDELEDIIKGLETNFGSPFVMELNEYNMNQLLTVVQGVLG